VGEFRYAQFCPLARATEIVGERWTLLVVRELLLGAQRFSDLLRRLAGVSSSVLADRLARLEARGVVRRRELPPPACASVYELTERGLALRPAVLELARWGARFLEPPRPGEHLEPDWLKLACMVFARAGDSPARAFRVVVPGPGAERAFFVRGGPAGTRVLDTPCEADACLRADPLTLLALLSGRAEPAALLRSGALSLDGEVDALADFPALFDFGPRSPNQERSPS
jgi:DNA-binding HxlR family transcriptional regulator